MSEKTSGIICQGNSCLNSLSQQTRQEAGRNFMTEAAKTGREGIPRLLTLGLLSEEGFNGLLLGSIMYLSPRSSFPFWLRAAVKVWWDDTWDDGSNRFPSQRESIHRQNWRTSHIMTNLIVKGNGWEDYDVPSPESDLRPYLWVLLVRIQSFRPILSMTLSQAFSSGPWGKESPILWFPPGTFCLIRIGIRGGHALNSSKISCLKSD